MFFILSLVFLLLSIIEIIPSAKVNLVLYNLGLAVFSSGVFAAVLKSIQFTGIFKEELEKIILGTDFVENRKDLDDLWRKISKSIYKSKFPEISSHLEERILKTYFPTDYDYYYEDYIATININGISDELEITYTQTIKFSLVLDQESDEGIYEQVMSIDDAEYSKRKDSENSKEDIENPRDQEHLESAKKYEDAEQPRKKIVNELVYFKLDGKKIEPKVDPKIVENKLVETLTVPLKAKGSKKYQIESRFNRTYSLKGENFKLLRFKTFTKNVDVFISYPKDISVSFFNVGNVNFFEKHHTDVPCQISRSHRNDVILPYQGFGMSFDKLSGNQ